jgi:flagellin-specific chaperone FliS
MQGDLDKELGALDEVVGLLSELLKAWEQVASKGEAKAQLGNRYNRAVLTARGITA